MESAPLIKSLPIPDTLPFKKKGGEKWYKSKEYYLKCNT